MTRCRPVPAKIGNRSTLGGGNRAFDGSTDDHVGAPNAADHCPDTLHDTVTGGAALEQ